MATTDMIDLTLLGRMVERLQAAVEGVRADYAAIRGTLNTFDGRFSEMNMRLSGLELSQMRLIERVEKFETLVDQQLGGIGKRLDSMDTRLERVESRMDAIEAKIGAIEGKMDAIDGKIGAIEGRFGAIGANLGALDVKIDVIRTEMNTIVNLLDAKLDRILAKLS